MSDVASLIADMVRAGVDPELIGRAAAALAEREPVAIIDDQAERRRAKDRERKRLRNSAESSEKVEVSPSSSPCPLVPPSQTLPPIIPQTPSPAPKQNRATRLPADWALPAAWGQWAVSQGYPEQTIRTEAEKFRDFWISKGGKDAAKLDWQATWRNWMRNVSKGPRPTSQAPPGKSAFQQHQDEIYRKLKREAGDRDDEFTGTTLDLGSRDFRAH